MLGAGPGCWIPSGTSHPTASDGVILTVLVLLTTLTPTGQVSRPADRRLTASIPGDIMIGALVSVHMPPTAKQAQTRTCGEVREQYGIHRVEAAFQTVDDINRNDTILPNITLGVEIRDSCWYSPTALEQSIEFIRDAIALVDDMQDNTTGMIPVSTANCPVRPARRSKNLVGVIGPGSSSTTIQVQNLLQLFNIPQIGYSATSRDLSDKSFYKYFMRVVPSDHYQAQVMVDILKKYNLTYISTVHTDGNYGGSGIEAFNKLAHDSGICIAYSDSVVYNAPESRFEDIVRNLMKYDNSRVIACFCEGFTIRGLLMATNRLKLVGKFLFLGSDGWADRHDVVQDYEREAVGGLSVRIYSTYVRKFDDYYFSLTPENNARNPWFKEFWETRFNCSLGLNPHKYNKTCTGRENLRDRYKQDTKMAFVKKSIWTFAYALHNMQKTLCPEPWQGLCSAMVPINGSVLLQHLLNVSFIWGEDNETVQFDEFGDPPARYDIMNFQQLNGTHFDYVNVGSWITGQLSISRPIQWQGPSSDPPESVCSKPCGKGEVKSIQSESVRCCWVCLQCKEHEYLKNEYTCSACAQGWWPNENLTECYQLPIEYIHWSHTTAIVAMTVACLGVLTTVFVMGVFIRHNDTPVVKASTRELSYIIMVGMFLCYATTFAFLAKPTQITCFLSRLLPGLSFSLMYSALVTKTNRIARILAGSKKKIITKKPRFMSATAQVVITCLLISVEAGIIAAMLVFEPADSMLSYPSMNRVKLVCNTTPLGVIAPLGFDFFLIAMCTIYAVKTRNVPENFNEAKFIGFTMYTTLVIWLAFIPTYFGSKSKVITMCLCVSFSANVALALLFFPKVYIILFRPEKNNRSAFTTAKNMRCHIGYVNSGVSRNSSHSTSDFSVESPRNHSLEVSTGGKVRAQDSKNEPRRPSFNIFERFRINKQDKIAKHIQAVRAAEALDRRTKFRRQDSFHCIPELPHGSSVTSGTGAGTGVSESGASQPYKGPAVRTPSGDSPGQERRKLVHMLRQTYGSDSEDIPGFEELLKSVRFAIPREEAACQTEVELIESWWPSLRRRVVRSETLMSTLTPEDEDADDEPPPYSASSARHEEYDPGRMESHEMQRLISGTSQTKRSASLRRSGAESRASELASIQSEESLLDAASSIVEESASSGSEDTPGSGVYKNIIISLASPGSRPLSSAGTRPSSFRSSRDTAGGLDRGAFSPVSLRSPAGDSDTDLRHING